MYAMLRIIALVALTNLIAAGAHACPPGQEVSGQSAKEGCPYAKPRTHAKTPAEQGDISRADKENLERAMGRNVQQSIDDQLRRQRVGN